MKLAHYLINNPVSWEEINVNTFIIENPKLYREFLMEFYKQVIGEDGNFVLSDGLEILDLQKNVELVDSLIGLDIENNKKILTAITKELTEIAINDYNVEVMQVYTVINNLLSNLIFHSGQDLSFDELNDISQILKLYNVRPDFENLSLAETVLLYMELCEKYLKKKLFVFLDFHSYFTQEEMDLLLKNFEYRDYKVFIVERYDIKTSKAEKKRIIDVDLCEI